ncbi:MAG: DUF4363 family protein [Mycobacterium leprae]
MRKWLYRLLYFGVPVVVLALTVVIMNTGPVLKRPMGQNDDVEAKLSAVAELAVTGQWQDATATMEELNAAWHKVRERVRFHSEDREIEALDLEMAQLQGAVEGHSQADVRIATRRLQALWDDLAS